MKKQRKQPRTCKIFVGGLPKDISLLEFRHYFEVYGEINDIVVMRDKETQKARGFGFVSFCNEHTADQVMLDKRHHRIKNKWIDCKRAVPQSELSEGAITNKNTFIERTDAI